MIPRFPALAAALTSVVALTACGSGDAPAPAPVAAATDGPTGLPPGVIDIEDSERAPGFVPAPEIVTAPPPRADDAPASDPEEDARNGYEVSPQGVPAVFDASDLSKQPIPTGLGDDVPRPKRVIVQDLVPGTGEAVAVNDTAEVKYVGARYRDGKIFDSSWGGGGSGAVPLPLRGMIPGFREGMAGMKVGGRRLLVIPAAGGFGPAGAVDVPPDTDLVYVVDLVKVSA